MHYSLMNEVNNELNSSVNNKWQSSSKRRSKFAKFGRNFKIPFLHKRQTQTGNSFIYFAQTIVLLNRESINRNHHACLLFQQYIDITTIFGKMQVQYTYTIGGNVFSLAVDSFSWTIIPFKVVLMSLPLQCIKVENFSYSVPLGWLLLKLKGTCAHERNPSDLHLVSFVFNVFKIEKDIRINKYIFMEKK